MPSCLDHGPQPKPTNRYCFKAFITDGDSTKAPFTFFTPIADAITKFECNKLRKSIKKPDVAQTESSKTKLSEANTTTKPTKRVLFPKSDEASETPQTKKNKTGSTSSGEVKTLQTRKDKVTTTSTGNLLILCDSCRLDE